MTKPGTPAESGEETAQRAIDALLDVNFNALSFIQLKRLDTALADARRRVVSETGRRAESDAQGDTVRVAVPPSLDH
jgi:hypothetical protein